MGKRRAVVLATVILGMVGLAVVGGFMQMRAALAAEVEGLRIAPRERTFLGRSEGEVTVGDLTVVRIRAGAGGMTAHERAQKVADRLASLVRERNLRSQDLRVALVNGEWAVLGDDTIIITAEEHEAALNRTTPRRLAGIWRGNLSRALTAQVAGFRGEAERVSNKLVPIVSLGSGIRVGAARISGSADRVEEASVVGQVETTFQDVVRIRIFVPLQSVTNISRVPQVNVTGYADIRL